MTPTLTDDGMNALLEQPPTELVLYQLWFRRNSKDRWTKCGRYSTQAEALAAIGGGGDWWIEEQRAE